MITIRRVIHISLLVHRAANIRSCLIISLGKKVMQRGAHAGAGLLAGLVTPWGPTLEQPIPEGLHPVEGTHIGTVHEELQPVGRTHVCGELSPVRGTSCWSRGRV